MSNGRDRKIGEITADIKWIKENINELNKKMDSMMLMGYQNKDEISNMKKLAAGIAAFVSFIIGIIIKFIKG